MKTMSVQKTTAANIDFHTSLFALLRCSVPCQYHHILVHPYKEILKRRITHRLTHPSLEDTIPLPRGGLISSNQAQICVVLYAFSLPSPPSSFYLLIPAAISNVSILICAHTLDWSRKLQQRGHVTTKRLQ